MQTIFHLPEIFREDSAWFKQQTERFHSGAVSAAEFRSFRVPLGVYEQREAETFMLRVRFPAGGVLPHQMRALAAVSRRYGDGVLHVTTRQDIQVHRVLLDDVHQALAELYDAGLSTRGGGGNTVRNICGCPDAGVCPNEVLDVTAYVVALTEFLLPDPLSYNLPRKYKIAFVGCSGDCPGVAVNDLGFVARRCDGTPGFGVYVGGGMGAKSRVADLLHEFVPASEVHYVAEAVKRVFDRHGNRKNRHRARLRFLIEQIGLQRFRELYEAELAGLRKSGLPELRLRELPRREGPTPAGPAQAGEGFARWRRSNLAPQKQEGYYLVQIPLLLGDIGADTLEKLAEIAQQHGEGMMRTTQWQNLVMRWVHDSELGQLHAALDSLGLAVADPPVVRNLIACTGAATCKLGICLSRGLAKAVRDILQRDGSDLDRLGDLKIYISGCPNSCGRHPVADIGFFGAARRVKGRLVPHYVLQLGGKVAQGQTRLAQGKRAVAARNVPALVADLLAAFGNSPQCSDFGRFLEAEGRQLADDLVTKYAEVPDFYEEKDYYFDWGAEEMFSLGGRGPGECGAGVFDLIEVDLASAREAVEQGRLFEATVLAARSLLVTRGEQARDESEALALFRRHFIEEKLVDDHLAALVIEAERAAQTPRPADCFVGEPAEVQRLVQTVQKLYDHMDPSLRFSSVTEQPAAAAVQAECPPQAAREADFRGVVCPLNYVKTKMLLDQLGSGEVLSVLLDEQGARSVPESVEKDGHDVLSVRQEGPQWRVLIRKRSRQADRDG
jgi:sulfite reductase (ferredoxin)